MRILLITGMVSRKLGSIEELVVALGLEAKRRSSEVAVVYKEHPKNSTYLKRLSEAGIDLIILPYDERCTSSFRYLVSLISLIRRWRPDVVHTFFGHDRQIAVIATLICRVRKKFINVWSPGPPGGMRFFIGYRLLSRYAKIIFGTEDTRSGYLEKGLSVERTELIHVGINLKRFDPGRWHVGTFRQRLGVGPLETLCAVIGDARYIPGQNGVDQLLEEDDKGLTFVIRAAAFLKERDVPCHFAIAGGGPLMEHFKKLALRLGISQYIHFLGIIDDIPLMLSDANIFVTASAVDTFGLALLEAMALGKPVVVCDSGGAREVILHAKNGLLFPPKGVNALADCIEKLVTDPSLGRRMGFSARALMESEFNIDRTVGDFIRIYESG